MIKIIVTTVLTLLPFLGFSQNIFDKFEDREGIEAITINKEMFSALGNVDMGDAKDAKNYMGMVKDFDQLKVFTTENKKLGKELKAAVASYLKTNPLSELMSVNDGGSKVKIYARQGNDPALIKECLIFIQDAEDKEVVVLSFTGNINPNDVKKLKDN